MSKKEFDRKHFNFAVPIDTIATDGDQANQQRTFDGLAYSGAVIPRHFVFENLYIDLDSVQAKSQIPIFRDHDASLVAGHGNLYKDSDNKLRIAGNLSNNQVGSDITTLADEGFQWEMSIGAVPEFIEEVKAGKEVFINGELVRNGATIFRNTRIIETSFVPIGADSNTEVSVFSKDGIQQEKETITVEVKLMENEIKPVETAAPEVVAPEVEIKETVAAEVTEEVVVEETAAELKIKVDALTAELACSCTEKQEAKSDLEKAQDTIKQLQDELNEMRSAQQKENFAARAGEVGMDLSTEQVDFFHAELSEEKFEKVLSIMSEQAKNIKPSLPQALMSKDNVEVNLGSSPSKDDPADITAKAKAIQAKLSGEGKEISFSDAVAKIAVASDWKV